MRLNKSKTFNTPAITVGRHHYFPSVNDVDTLVDGKISMSVCFYSHSRRKWLSDTAYLAIDKAKEIINYASKRGVLLER